MLDCLVFSADSVCTRRARARRTCHGWTKARSDCGGQRNAETNGLAEKCSFETTNVFDWLKAQTTAGPHEKVVPRYDLIILDPPSFTRNRASVPDALRGYKEIHLRALKLFKTGGTLATFCCSHHVDAGLFQDSVLSAAFDAREFSAASQPTPNRRIIQSFP